MMTRSGKVNPTDAIQRMRESLESFQGQFDAVGSRKKKLVRGELEKFCEELSQLAASLDAVSVPLSLFDPANPLTIGRFVGMALVAQDLHRLDKVPQFYGSGVYALYYNGSSDIYAPISGTESPIYVGKADPVMPTATTPREQGKKLSERLEKHRQGISRASGTLDITDFNCRFLVVQSGWQGAAEYYLINSLKPVWNSEVKICYGFGKHGDSAETRNNKRSPWDTLHPGRKWAGDAKLQDAKPRTQIISEIKEHLELYPPFKNVQAIFEQFLTDLKQL